MKTTTNSLKAHETLSSALTTIICALRINGEAALVLEEAERFAETESFLLLLSFNLHAIKSGCFQEKVSCRTRRRSSNQSRMRPKIILFGDSITEESFGDGGWGASLANHFARSVDVVLRGYSGYNSRWALQVLEKVFAGYGEAPKVVTVFFGANDACLPDRTSAFQHVPQDEYSENLKAIVSFIKKQWLTTVVLLITPPPIDEDGRLRHPYGENPSGLPERTNEAAGAYAKACIAVAEECGVPVIDTWTKMQQFQDWEKSFLRDGLHLTPSGNKIVFEEVIEKLGKEGLNVETLPVDLPLLSDINPSDPLKAFQNLNPK